MSQSQAEKAPAHRGVSGRAESPDRIATKKEEERKMVQTLWLIRDKVLSFLKSERAQDTFEYVLIIGGVTVAVIIAIAAAAPSLLSEVISGVCSAVATIPGMSGVSC
jgi:Flp pilus assembly pilin Flp